MNATAHIGLYAVGMLICACLNTALAACITRQTCTQAVTTY